MGAGGKYRICKASLRFCAAPREGLRGRGVHPAHGPVSAVENVVGCTVSALLSALLAAPWPEGPSDGREELGDGRNRGVLSTGSKQKSTSFPTYVHGGHQ